LPAGMVFVQFTSLSVSSSSVTSNDGVTATSTVIDLTDVAALNAAAASTTDPSVVVSNNGRDFLIDFDRLQNTAVGIETFTLTYEALVTNVASNVSGQTLQNTATTQWDDGGLQTKIATTAPQVVREPSVSIDKSIVLTGAGEAVNGLGQVVYQFVIAHNGDQVTAHDIVITDDLRTVTDPNGAPPIGATGFMDFYLDYVVGSITSTTSAPGTQQVGLTESVDGFTLSFDDLAFGETATITATFVVDSEQLNDGLDFDNAARVDWSSMVGDTGSDISPYSTDDDSFVERTASSGVSALNIYTDSDLASETISYVDLELQQTLSISEARPGDTVTYTVRVANTSGEDATGVVATVPLPDGVGFVSAVATQGTYDFVNNQWTIGAIDFGDEYTLTITALVAESGELSSRAFISGTDQVDVDSVPSSVVTSEDDESPVLLTVTSPSTGSSQRGLLGCKDTAATNYDASAAAHRSSLCTYPPVLEVPPTTTGTSTPPVDRSVIDKIMKDLTDILSLYGRLFSGGSERPTEPVGGGKGAYGYDETLESVVRQDESNVVVIENTEEGEVDVIVSTGEIDLAEVIETEVADPESQSFWQWMKGVLLFWR